MLYLPGGLRTPSGGQAATRSMENGIRDAFSLALIASGQSRQTLFGLAKQKTMRYAELFPGKLHVTSIHHVRFGSGWLVGILGFGVGRLTIKVERLSELGFSFSIPADLRHLLLSEVSA
jgi:hypothetical protein